MRYFLSFVFVVFLGPFAYSQSVTLPPKIQLEVGEATSINIAFEGTSIRFTGAKIGSKKLNVIRELTDDPKDCVVSIWAMSEGEYELKAISCKEGKLSPFAICIVTVGSPKPNPNPKPPEPIPTPPIPVPDDPIAKRLKDSFKEDEGEMVDKFKGKETLRNFLVVMPEHIKNPSVKTVGDLLSDYKSAQTSAFKPGAIIKLRTQIAKEILDTVGDDPSAPISDDMRKKLINLFELMAAILKTLG